MFAIWFSADPCVWLLLLSGVLYLAGAIGWALDRKDKADTMDDDQEVEENGA
jgi:predicted membrane channel-forming protein YqfA (hemolysin III family)